MSDNVDHPNHYNLGTMEVIEAIDGLGCDFYQGNIVKYVARFRAKGGVEDLRKARWYLDRLITLELKDSDSWRQPKNGLKGSGQREAPSSTTGSSSSST